MNQMKLELLGKDDEIAILERELSVAHTKTTPSPDAPVSPPITRLALGDRSSNVSESRHSSNRLLHMDEPSFHSRNRTINRNSGSAFFLVQRQSGHNLHSLLPAGFSRQFNHSMADSSDWRLSLGSDDLHLDHEGDNSHDTSVTSFTLSEPSPTELINPRSLKAIRESDSTERTVDSHIHTNSGRQTPEEIKQLVAEHQMEKEKMQQQIEDLQTEKQRMERLVECNFIKYYLCLHAVCVMDDTYIN